MGEQRGFRVRPRSSFGGEITEFTPLNETLLSQYCYKYLKKKWDEFTAAHRFTTCRYRFIECLSCKHIQKIHAAMLKVKPAERPVRNSAWDDLISGRWRSEYNAVFNTVNYDRVFIDELTRHPDVETNE